VTEVAVDLWSVAAQWSIEEVDTRRVSAQGATVVADGLLSALAIVLDMVELDDIRARRGRLAVVGELGVDAALRVGAALVRVMNENVVNI
jgi:hypothetical protein